MLKEFAKCLMAECDCIREQERQIKSNIKGVKEEIKALKQQLNRPVKDVKDDRKKVNQPFCLSVSYVYTNLTHLTNSFD
jgi:septal ring factor EnvC (AmiA/AmiB activator)